jgi:hypothetical protein
MNLAVFPDWLAQAKAGHVAIDGDRNTGSQTVRIAQAHLDAGVNAVECLNDLADGCAGHCHGFLSVRNVAQ